MAETAPQAVSDSSEETPGFFVGLDVGGTKTAVLLVDRALQTVAQSAAPTRTRSPEALVEGIHDAVLQAMREAPIDPALLLAVGAGVPGMVEPRTGLVRLAVNLNLQQYPLGDALARRFGVPVALENDVRAASLGAYAWLNRRERVRYMAYLSIGTGISAGLVLDGRLHRGAQGMAGEIGHVIFDPRGERCACGLTGCLESIAAGPSIARQYAAGSSSAEVVFAAAEEGDPAARVVVDRAALAVARAIQLLVMTYDVERVVLGGGVLSAGDAFLKPIRTALAAMRDQSALAQRMLPPQVLVAAPQHADVARQGAVLLALQAFANPKARPQTGETEPKGVRIHA